jgi:acyl-CoA synthetase (NDP forming)
MTRPLTAPGGATRADGCPGQAGILGQIRGEILRSGPGGLGEASTRRLLEPAGVPFVPSTPVTSEDQAAAAAAAAGGTVVLKALSDEVLHKTDAGLVELGLAAPGQVRGAYRRLCARIEALRLADAAVVLQPMAPPGVDLFLGWVRDSTFGPVIVTGLGGVNLELFRDVARAVPPLADADVRGMLGSLDSAPLLSGYRGAPPVDTTRFRRLVTALGELALALPELAELDLNPVRVFPDGRCQALDACAVIAPAQPGQAAGHARVRPAGSLDALMRPRSVAVIGASRDARRPGGRVLRSLLEHEFGGPVYPVNPAGGEIAGMRAVASLDQLREVPDLACIALPAAASIAAARECTARHVPAVIVYASGFSEAGPGGRELDDQLRAAVAGSGTLLCGPNTIGIVSAHHRMAATFSRALEGLPLEPSGTCLIAQSGAVAGSLVSRELSEGYGIGEWVTVGNQSQLDVAAYIGYCAGLPTTRSIAVFLEGVPDGSAFRAALRAARKAGIPVVVFKTGLTDAGRKAVASHSGALAGSGSAYRAVLAQEGAVQVGEMTALLETAWVLGHAPRPAGRRVGVITTSGGAGSATVDLVSQNGLELAEFASATRGGLADVLPDFAGTGNPLDVTAEGAFAEGTVRRVIDLVSGDPGVDLVCVVLTSITGADAVRVARQVADAARRAERAGQPVLVSWLVARPLAREGMELLARSGVRVFAEPARMVATAAHLAGGAGSKVSSGE